MGSSNTTHHKAFLFHCITFYNSCCIHCSHPHTNYMSYQDSFELPDYSSQISAETTFQDPQRDELLKKKINITKPLNVRNRIKKSPCDGSLLQLSETSTRHLATEWNLDRLQSWTRFRVSFNTKESNWIK